MVDKREVTESIDSYLGEEEKAVLRTLSKNTLKLFLSKRIQLGKSYIVRGTPEILKQFKAFYLVSCNKGTTRFKFGSYMMSEYASTLTNGDPNGDLVVDELLFLYAHKNDIDLGNSETWLAKTIVNSVANRNRKGYATVLLTERDLPLIKQSGELEYINLTTKAIENRNSNTVKAFKEQNKISSPASKNSCYQ